MKASSLPAVLRSLGLADSSAESDAALLGRFVADGDQWAFAVLVRRYARLVWQVARTRCRSDATAEDVFQAAFLVLARKAESIRPPVALAGWLHLTAHRLALRAARKDRPSAPLPGDTSVSADPLDTLSAREVLAAVDDEMAQLSDVERAVLVLCGVDDCTLDEAAERLGWTVGSVKGRLERARAKLRARLDARGLTVPTVLVGLIGWPPAAMVRAAALAAVGGTTRPAVAHLISEGRTLKGTIAKAALTLALVGALLAIGGWGERPVPRATAAPVPKGPPRETRLLVWVGDKPVLLRPDGTVLDGPAAVPDATLRVMTSNAVSSPDGTRVVFAGETDPPEPVDDSKGVVVRRGVRLLTLKPGETPRVVKRFGAYDPVWLGSDRLVLSGRELADDGTTGALKTWVYDTTTGTRTALKVPEKFAVRAVSPDGRSAVAIDKSIADDQYTWSCHLVSLDEGKTVPLLGADHVIRSPFPPQFSLDGARVLLWTERVAIDPNKKIGGMLRVKFLGRQLLAVDVKTRKAVVVADDKDGVGPFGWQWSPDGKRIAFVRQKWDAVRGNSLKGRSQLFVTVVDADGKNPKDVFETRGSFEDTGRTGVTAVWSPDGRRLAVLHQEACADKKYSARVVVMDADGGRPSEVYKAGDTSWVLMGFDWR
ncbi:ECF RNA polymerase sigma factor SigW [Gemmata sp. SH-PL17]|uniref:sigma-70 family RNA polymerase sigma factor n=1 Tax=Gemmata sp. SH-PL17 TaxID=1630693 RepID=UPI00078D6D59|nr:sigma-70 family RNA polymerase sigma factor [Gemmata sp. SH-PL17]AMV24200.1 ECF RNA polymerase sigma factor SigW [Gemmata sp. SH-PL17]